MTRKLFTIALLTISLLVLNAIWWTHQPVTQDIVLPDIHITGDQQ